MSELTSPTEKKFEVSYDIAFTKNMGNFQSLKVNVGLTREGAGGKADMDRVFAQVREWVEDNLGTAVTEVSSALEDDSE